MLLGNELPHAHLLLKSQTVNFKSEAQLEGAVLAALTAGRREDRLCRGAPNVRRGPDIAAPCYLGHGPDPPKLRESVVATPLPMLGLPVGLFSAPGICNVLKNLVFLMFLRLGFFLRASPVVYCSTKLASS